MDSKSDFDSEAILGELNDIVHKYDVPFDVQTVPNIQEWSSAQGIVEENSSRSGAVFRNIENGRYLVVLANPITSDMIRSAIEAMLMNDFGDATDALWEPKKFVTHLLLHEVAHALDHSRTERQCDEWAFHQLGIRCAV